MCGDRELLLETLFAIAVAVATLKAHGTPPAEPPKVVATERREAKVERPKQRTTLEPSIGF